MTDSQKLDLILSEIQGTKADTQGLKTDMKNLKADIQDLKTETKHLKADIQNLKTETKHLKADIQNLKTETKHLKADIQDLKTETKHLNAGLQNVKERIAHVEGRVTDLALYLENHTSKNIQLLAENFSGLTDKLNQAIPVADKNFCYEVKVDYLTLKVKKFEKLLTDAGLIQPTLVTT